MTSCIRKSIGSVSTLFLRLGIAWLLGSVVLVGASACGGGGSSEETRLSLSANPSSLDITFLQRLPPATLTVSLSISLQSGPNPGSVFLAVQADQSLLSDISIPPGGGSMSISIRPDLSPGKYVTSITVRACKDPNCASEYLGNRATVPLTIEVLPNIQGPGPIVLSRTGSQVLAPLNFDVVIPSRVENAVAVVIDPPTASISASLMGSRLQITPNPVSAGRYQTEVKLIGGSDYSWTIPLTYTVEAPIGGEKSLAVNTTEITETVVQGKTTVRRLSVTAPTWLPDEPIVKWASTPPTWASIVKVAPNEYDVTLSAVNMDTCFCAERIFVDAGPYGGSLDVFVRMPVTPLLTAQPFLFNVQVAAGNTSQDLPFSTAISAYQGQQISWKATTTSPRLRLTRANGTTGVDALQFEVIAANVTPLQFSDEILVTTDDTGVRPMTVIVYTSRQVIVSTSTPSSR
jgi:hypothetical protein